MTRDRFHNRLRILTSIDLHELQEGGPGPFEEPTEWASFRDDPFRYFVSCSDEACDRIWQVVLKRDARSNAREADAIAGHTATPWHFYELQGAEPDGCGYIRGHADNKEISHHGDRGRSRAENLANAALLIAGANSYCPRGGDIDQAVREYRRSVQTQLEQLHAELGSKRDRVFAESPKDRVGQAHAEGIIKGVGKAIGMLQSMKPECGQ